MNDDECKECGDRNHLLPGSGWRCKRCGVYNATARTETDRINRASIAKRLREIRQTFTPTTGDE